MLRMFAMALVITFAALGCDTKVRQAQPPRIPDDPNESAALGDGSDISAEPEEIVPVEEKKLTAADKRLLCCQECVAGIDADRSGDAPEKIPCQDFTVEVKKRCLKWFHDNPMNAAEARACVAEAPAPEPPAESP